MIKEIKVPEISLVLLVGPSSAGKSTFARKHFAPTEILSSDYCRALVSDDENNLDATQAAFEVLYFIATQRLKRGKLTVVDALNLQKEDRARLVQLAKDNYALAVAIVLETPIRQLFDRHTERPDRHFGKNVIEHQHENFKRTLKTIEKEGFTLVHYTRPEDEVKISRQKLWNNRQEERGPFDIIGDIHGCFDELTELIEKLGYQLIRSQDGIYEISHPENRKLVFLGDLTDRGDKSVEVLSLVMDAVQAGTAFCVSGNHDEKLFKYLIGKKITPRHGLEKTIQELEHAPKAFVSQLRYFLDGLIAHYVFDDGQLVVAHAGLPEAMHGRASGAVRAFCLYGETNGEIDEFGLPVRYDWAKNYRGKATVVYGHTPIPEAEWVNNTINIDTGCVFGGKLTALRYPEKDLVSVNARKVYCEPVRPLLTDQPATLDPYEDVLDIDVISGKKLIETRFFNKVIIREENAVAALEVMSRFAIQPQWLIYLPPTMSPPETSALPQYLEHPQEVFHYYEKNEVKQVICEEKHMGSRAIAIVCRTPETAQTRFGLQKAALGTVYTRTGRPFFENREVADAFLWMLHQALSETGFWEKFDTDWVCLDGELMPWSAKARDLLIKQYAATGSAAQLGLGKAHEMLQKAVARGLPAHELLEKFTARQERIGQYQAAYRNYCRTTNGLRGLVYAPFHILATEGKVWFDRPHTWHLSEIATICAQNEEHLLATPHLLVDLENPESKQAAIDWWVKLTAAGGEGMVVKPVDFIAHRKGRAIQPAMKCRGSEYLRIIYGPEYDTPENLASLKVRSVKAKRELAIKEFTLGLEALSRFVDKTPIRQYHECVFGILALESEEIDPRL